MNIKPLLTHDNLEEFRDPAVYDAVNDLTDAEGRFFADLAREHGGPILDIACGTGRMTIPLAEQGYDVTGVDLTPEMLEAAARKSSSRRVALRWVQADARQLDLGRTYRMIYATGNAFQAFLDRDAQEGLLRSVHRHLDDGGVFAFETRNPVLAKLADAGGEEAEEDAGSFVDSNGRCVRMTERHSYDHATQLEHYVIAYHRVGASGGDETRENRIAIRYVFPKELETLLHYNGLAMQAMFGHFDRRPFEAASPLMVCVCRKRRD